MPRSLWDNHSSYSPSSRDNTGSMDFLLIPMHKIVWRHIFFANSKKRIWYSQKESLIGISEIPSRSFLTRGLIWTGNPPLKKVGHLPASIWEHFANVPSEFHSLSKIMLTNLQYRFSLHWIRINLIWLVRECRLRRIEEPDSDKPTRGKCRLPADRCQDQRDKLRNIFQQSKHSDPIPLCHTTLNLETITIQLMIIIVVSFQFF